MSRRITVDELTDDDIGKFVAVQSAGSHQLDTDGILCDIKDSWFRLQEQDILLVIDGKIVESYGFLEALVHDERGKKRKTGIGWHKDG